MTGPRTYTEYRADPQAQQTEWDDFTRRRKELMDLMTHEIHSTVAPPSRTMSQQPAPTQLLNDAGMPLRPQARDDAIAAARAWGIDNPEQMDTGELQRELEAMRRSEPRQQGTTMRSFGLAYAGAAAEAAAGTYRVLGNILGTVDKIPGAGHILSTLLQTEKSKNNLYDMEMSAKQASEYAAIQQPTQDLAAYQFLSGAGYMAGYALPAMAAWEALGAAGAVSNLTAWSGRAASPMLKAGLATAARISASVSNPMVRGAIQGGASGALLEGGSDEDDAHKVQAIGLGAVMGGAAGFSSRLGASVGLGAIGAGVGGSVGATPEERMQHAVEFGIGAATLPFLAPVLAKAFQKVSTDIPTPYAQKFSTAQLAAQMEQTPGIGAGPAGPGAGAPPRATARVVDSPSYPSGPDYTTEPIVQLGVRSDPTGERVYLPGMDPTGVSNPSQAAVIPSEPTLGGPQRATGLLASSRQQVNTDYVLNHEALPDVTAPPDPYVGGYLPGFKNSPAMQTARGNVWGQPPAKPVSLALANTKVVNSRGEPLVVYHGTSAAYDMPDPALADPGALFGPGALYTTEDPSVASTVGYTGEMTVQIKADRMQELYDKIEALKPPTVGPQLAPAYGPSFGIAGVDPSSPEEIWKNAADALSYRQLGPGDLAGFSQLGIDIQNYIEPTSAPNVRPMRLNITNPFDIDKSMQPHEVADLIDKLEAANPGYNWNKARSIMMSEVNDMQRTGLNYGNEDFYRQLEMVNTIAPVHGAEGGDAQWWQNDPGSTRAMQAQGANVALRLAGYDGITHEGGGRMGGGHMHRVWIPFEVSQIHPPWEVAPMSAYEAVAQATSMGKQATVMESPELASALRRQKITDADIARHMKVMNPGAASVMKGVNADQPTISELLYNNPEIQFVQREGRLDALVGDGLTPEMIEQYKEHGMFIGQEAQTATWQKGVVETLPNKQGMMTVHTNDGMSVYTDKFNVYPGRYQDTQSGQMDSKYEDFKSNTLAAINEDMAQAGMEPVTSLTDSRVSGMMNSYVEQYLDSINAPPAVRQVMEKDFNARWVDEFKALDPEAQAIQQRMADMTMVEQNANVGTADEIPVSMEERAMSKGFLWVTGPEEGGTLRDLVNPEGALELPMETDDAANQFLQNIDRTLPSAEPASDVPVEVIGMVPSESTLEPRMTAEHLTNALAESDAMPSETGEGWVPPSAGGGGAGLPPGHYAMGGIPPEPPQPPKDLADQFARGDPVKINRYFDSLNWKITAAVRYTRYAMLALEKNLGEMGIDMGKAWSHYEELATASTRSKNESKKWVDEWGTIMREYSGGLRKTLRDGSVMRIHGIGSPTARQAAYEALKTSHGFDDGQIAQLQKTDAKISDFMGRFFLDHSGGDQSFAATAERQMMSYMNEVRARQAQSQGTAGKKDYEKIFDSSNLPDALKFFGDQAKGRNMQFRLVDPRELGVYLVRSSMFHRFEAEPWQQMSDAWHLDRPMYEGASPIPLEARQFMGDYARLSRYGYDPSGFIAVKGTKAAFYAVGLKITSSEAAHLLNIPRGLMYMSMLAGRSSIFFRDTTQILMSLAKVEVNHLGGVLNDVLRGKDADTLRAMLQRGRDGGWIEAEQGQLEGVNMWEDQQILPDKGDLAGITQQEVNARELMASIGDKFAGLPNWLIDPANSKISTLRAYGKLGQMHRLIVGESALRQAESKLFQYRKSILDAAMTKDPTKAQTYDQFAEDSFFGSFEKPIQRKLKELVDSGDDNGAAQLFAREVTSWSQFRYGRKEMPAFLRGQVGSWLGMFGSFSGQFAEAAYSALSNGSPRHIVRAAGLGIGVSAALRYAHEKTGWGFDNWVWENSLAYTGGPLMSPIATAYQAGAGLVNESQDHPVSWTEEAALRDVGSWGSERGLGNLGGSLNPYSGYVKSVNELFNAQQGTNAFEQTSRYIVTGDRGSSIDTHRIMEQLSRSQDSTRAARPQGQDRQAFPRSGLSPNGGLQPSHAGSGNVDLGQPYKPTPPGSGAQQ